MEEANRNRANGDKSYNREDAKSPFCEQLLDCCACGKIYFSRQPIVLLALGKKTFRVCAECSKKLKCSICGKPLPLDNAMAVENISGLRTGFLCPGCREIILSRFRTVPRSFGIRMWLKMKFAVAVALSPFRRIGRISIWPRHKNR
ncbi:hypothetical protein HZA56_01735 [Candidatus Poribacteria bacterium]|nr:hypothetical protein [Candidatus Poribacteria bacterium]